MTKKNLPIDHEQADGWRDGRTNDEETKEMMFSHVKDADDDQRR